MHYFLQRRTGSRCAFYSNGHGCSAASWLTKPSASTRTAAGSAAPPGSTRSSSSKYTRPSGSLCQFFGGVFRWPNKWLKVGELCFVFEYSKIRKSEFERKSDTTPVAACTADIMWESKNEPVAGRHLKKRNTRSPKKGNTRSPD